MNKPVNQKIRVMFFKKTGKYYTVGNAIVNHFLWEDEFKHDLVNTQDSLKDGWQGEFQVLTEELDDDNETSNFATFLFDADSFVGIEREGTNE